MQVLTYYFKSSWRLQRHGRRSTGCGASGCVDWKYRYSYTKCTQQIEFNDTAEVNDLHRLGMCWVQNRYSYTNQTLQIQIDFNDTAEVNELRRLGMLEDIDPLEEMEKMTYSKFVDPFPPNVQDPRVAFGPMRDRSHLFVWCDSFMFVRCDSFIFVLWLIHMCAVTYLYVWCDSLTSVMWLIHTCDITFAYVWYGSFQLCKTPEMRLVPCVTGLICLCDVTHSCLCYDLNDMTHSYLWCDSFMFVTWLIHMCDVTRLYVCYDSSMCVIWRCSNTQDPTHATAQRQTVLCLSGLIYLCDMTRLSVRYDLFICVIWLICMCEVTRSYVGRGAYVWHDSFICVPWLIHMCADSLTCVTRLIHMCGVTLLYVWHDSWLILLVKGWM